MIFSPVDLVFQLKYLEFQLNQAVSSTSDYDVGSLWNEFSLNQIGQIFFRLKFYFQDTERMDKVSRRINQLQEINNNIKLLNEMLAHYSKEVSSQSDRDMMKVSNVYL